MKHYLVTGATGLIGFALIDTLVGQSTVTTLGRRPAGRETRWIDGDLSGTVDTSTLPVDVDTVVYLAQSEHFRAFPERADDIFQVNIANVQRLLAWSRDTGVKRFVYASSGGIYGHGDRAFREEDPITSAGPLGYYLASKQSAELLVESYAGLFTTAILRFFFVYGPRQKPQMLIPRLVESVRMGRPILLQGSDGIRINPTYVGDAVRAIVAASNLESSHCVNVAGPQVLSLRGIGDEIGRQLGRMPVFDCRYDEPPRHLVADISKLSKLLCAPKVYFDEGLARMLAG